VGYHVLENRGGVVSVSVAEAGAVSMTMGRDGISFGEGSYSTPVWSPRGDYIAFTKQGGRTVRDRHHEDGRLRLTHPHLRLPIMRGRPLRRTGRVVMFFREPGR